MLLLSPVDVQGFSTEVLKEWSKYLHLISYSPIQTLLFAMLLLSPVDVKEFSIAVLKEWPKIWPKNKNKIKKKNA